MSQLLDRFLRVVSGGKYSTKELLDTRRQKAEHTLRALAGQLERLRKLQLAPDERLQEFEQRLTDGRAGLAKATVLGQAARLMKDFQEACDLLEPIKKRAVATLAEARKLEPPVLDKYVRTKTSGQQAAIQKMADLCKEQLTAPLETPQDRQAFADRLNALEKDLQKQGLDGAEAGAVKASFLKRNLALINPELNTVFSDPRYDAAKDPAVKDLKPADFKQFLLQWDHTSFRVEELKGRLAKSFQNPPSPSDLKDFFAKNPSFKVGLLALLKPEFVPKHRRDAWAGPGVGPPQAVNDTPTEEELTEILTTAGQQKPPGISSMFLQPGQANSYQGNFPYSGLYDSADRMDRKVKALHETGNDPARCAEALRQKHEALIKLESDVPARPTAFRKINSRRGRSPRSRRNSRSCRHRSSTSNYCVKSRT